MFDSIISRGWAADEFLLQVDRQLASGIIKHLALYRGSGTTRNFTPFLLFYQIQCWPISVIFIRIRL
jgi:hypothetical protein